MPACKKIVAGPQTVSILSFNDNRESLSTYKINIISCEYIHGKALGYRDQVVRYRDQVVRTTWSLYPNALPCIYSHEIILILLIK